MKARFFAIAALVLGLASCQKDFAPEANLGGEVDYRLSVSAPELVMTRAAENGTDDDQNALDSAFGGVDYFQGTDWTTVDLRYTLEVYDADKDGNATSETPVKDRMVKVFDKYEQASFDLRLIQNRNYRFVVFADFVKNGAATAWTEAEKLTEDGLNHSFPKTLKEIALINEQINNESADAYFAGKLIVPTNASKNEATIELTRPYAKVRVVATDLAELNNNSTPAKVLVKYYAPNAQVFNAVDGSISGTNIQKFERTYEESDKYTVGYDAYTEKFVTVKGEETRYTHKTLFTDYILAVDEQKPIQFDVTVLDQNNKPIKTTYFNTEIPVQRNYLTTIIGNVLTTATEINVTIDDNFRGYYNPAIVFVGTAEQLQEAIDNYENGQTILFSDDIVATNNVLINQKEGVHYLIDGGNHKYDGIIEINGDARQADPDSVTLQNINFETTKTDISVIDANENKKYGKNYNYAHNITVKGCKFNLGEGSVAMKLRQSKNVRVVNCEMAAGHSFMQLYGCNGVAVEYVDVVAKNGISFGTSLNCVVKQSVFNNIGYGFRGEPGGDVVADGVEITASKPVVVRRLSAGNYNLTINGSQLNAPGYHVIFTNGEDDAAFVAPDGTFKFETDGDFLVFPVSERLFAYNAAGLQDLLDNAAGDTTIEFAADIEGNVMVPEIDNATITLDGREYKYNGCFQINGKSRYADATTEFVNINFETADASNFCDSAFIYCREYEGNTSVRYPDNVKIKDCTFTAKDDAVEKAVAAKFWSINGNLVVENSVATNLHSMIQLTSCSTANVSIDGAVIKNCKNGISVGDAASAAIKNATIASREYGVRADGAGEYVLNIEDSNIAANLPVVARKVKANYTINFAGNNTLTTAGEYQVVFTTGNDDKAFVAPAAFSHTGAYDFKVFPELDVRVNNVDDLNSAINNHNGTITVEAPIETNFLQIDDANEVVLNFAEGATLNSGTAGDYAVIAKNKSEVTINNLDVKASAGGVGVIGGAKLIFNGKAVKVGAATTSARYNFYVVDNSEAVINGGEFSFPAANRRAYVYVDAGSKVVINGGTFGKASTHKDYKNTPIKGDGEVLIYGGTFGFDPSAWVAEGYQAVYDSAAKTWTVQVI